MLMHDETSDTVAKQKIKMRHIILDSIAPEG